MRVLCHHEAELHYISFHAHLAEPSSFSCIITHRYDHDFMVHLLMLLSPSSVQTIHSGSMPLHHLVGTLPIFEFRAQIENSRYKLGSTTSSLPHLSIAPNCNHWASATSTFRYSVYAISSDEVGCHVLHILCRWYSFHRILHTDTCAIASAITVDAAGLTVSVPA